MKTPKRCSPLRLFYRGFADHDHVDVDMGDDPIGRVIETSFDTGICPNCSSVFRCYKNTAHPLDPNKQTRHTRVFVVSRILFLCAGCGWWQVRTEGSVFENRKLVWIR